MDGRLADVAYSTDRYSVDDNPYLSQYDHTYDGPWGRAYELYKKNTLTADTESGYERKDLDESFKLYREKFLALMDMEYQYKRGSLTASSKPDVEKPSALYLACFEDYKMGRLALDDILAWYNSYPGTHQQADAAFDKITPTQYTDNAAYVAKFDELKKQIRADSKVGSSIVLYAPMVETDSVEKAKYYLHEDVVGDLRAEMEAGRARQLAAYDALLKKYEAATAEEKVEMEADLAKAAERVAEDTWYRYAMEGYGPEMRLNGEWWANIIHVAGVDYGDTVVDDNGDTHVAIHLELDEYFNYTIRAGYSNAGRYVCMQDALCYVDSEYEYYYDELTGKLYYYSESGTAGKNISRGTSDYMFVLNGVKGISFTDLRFTGMDDDYLSHNDGCTSYPGTGADGKLKSALEIENHAYDRSVICLNSCYGIDILDCSFFELPVRAIFGRGVIENMTVEICSFVRLGSNAIHIGDGTAERNWKTGKNSVENMTVTNNYVHDVGRVYFPSAGIWIHYGRNLTAMRKRFGRTFVIYMQHILGQLTHNNLLDNNYVLNVRATDPKKQELEVYQEYIVEDRHIFERNTHYINGVDRIPVGVEDIIYAAGSYGNEGDPYALYDNNY